MGSRLPVSIKGVVLRDQKVALLRNERDEWELPGGKLETAESPEACVSREIEEELGISVQPARILDCWIYEPLPQAFVVIVTYGCVERGFEPLKLSDEHNALGWFTLEELAELPIPEGYRRSIRSWSSIIAL